MQEDRTKPTRIGIDLESKNKKCVLGISKTFLVQNLPTRQVSVKFGRKFLFTTTIAAVLWKHYRIFLKECRLKRYGTAFLPA